MDSVLFNGMPMHIYGRLPQIGEPAPNFALVGKDLSEISLHDLRGRRVVLNIFPSLDTDVCAASVRRFNKEAGELTDTSVLCVSMDLPFAAARFCTVNDISNVLTASAFRSEFGRSYGLELTDGPLRGLLARALVLIDKDGRVLVLRIFRDLADISGQWRDCCRSI